MQHIDDGLDEFNQRNDAPLKLSALLLKVNFKGLFSHFRLEAQRSWRIKTVQIVVKYIYFLTGPNTVEMSRV